MHLWKPHLLSSNHKSIMFTTDYFLGLLVVPLAAVATAFTIPGWGFNVVYGVNDNKDVKRQALVVFTLERSRLQAASWSHASFHQVYSFQGVGIRCTDRFITLCPQQTLAANPSHIKVAAASFVHTSQLALSIKFTVWTSVLLHW